MADWQVVNASGNPWIIRSKFSPRSNISPKYYTFLGYDFLIIKTRFLKRHANKSLLRYIILHSTLNFHNPVTNGNSIHFTRRMSASLATLIMFPSFRPVSRYNIIISPASQPAIVKHAGWSVPHDHGKHHHIGVCVCVYLSMLVADDIMTMFH